MPSSSVVEHFDVFKEALPDIHKLTSRQREFLVHTVIDSRSHVGVWIAERFEALSTREMLSSGAHQGRDYESAIEIESYWRQKPDRFEKLAMKVADRRVRAAPETEIDSFRSCLQDALDSPEWTDTYTSIIGVVSKRIEDRVQQLPRFKEWISARERATGTLRERAIGWRALEILIERDLNKKQKTLFDDVPLNAGNDLFEEVLGESFLWGSRGEEEGGTGRGVAFFAGVVAAGFGAGAGGLRDTDRLAEQLA